MNGLPCSKTLVAIPSAMISSALLANKFINPHWLYHWQTILRPLPQHQLSKICFQWSFSLEKFLFAADRMARFCHPLIRIFFRCDAIDFEVHCKWPSFGSRSGFGYFFTLFFLSFSIYFTSTHRILVEFSNSSEAKPP